MLAMVMGVIFFAISIVVGASPGAPAIVEKSQQLLLKKDRAGALKELNEALKTGKWSGRDRQRLQEAQLQLATAFITDKGQRAYELAQSILFQEPARAYTHLQEAMNFENGNVSVRLAQLRVEMLQGQCDKAEEPLLALTTEYPTSQDIQQLFVANQLCQDKYKPLSEWSEGRKDISEKTLHVRLAQAVVWGLVHHDRKAVAAMDELANAFRDFPEAHYWRWRVHREFSIDAQDIAQRYLMLCKSTSPQLRKKYINEPRLCLRAEEVERTMVSKENGDGA